MRNNENNFTKINVGKRLKTVRKALQLTQEQLSRHLGITKRSYISYEQGKRYPPFKILIKINKLSNTNLHWLLTGEGSPEYRDSIENNLLQYLEQLGVKSKKDMEGIFRIFDICAEVHKKLKENRRIK